MVFSSPDSSFPFSVTYSLTVLARYTPLSIHWTPPPPLSSPPWGSPVCGTDADRSTDNAAQCLLFVNDSAATVYIHRAWVRVLVSTCRLDSLHMWPAVYGHRDSVCGCHYHTANTHKHTHKTEITCTIYCLIDAVIARLVSVQHFVTVLAAEEWLKCVEVHVHLIVHLSQT